MNIPYYLSHESHFKWSSLAGGNARGILVLIPQQDLLPQKPYLVKVLSAAHIDLDKDTHYAGIDPEVRMSLLTDPQLRTYDCVFLFGISAEAAGLSPLAPSPYHLLQFETVTCIVAPHLQEIAQQPKAQKAILFQILKEVFLS